MQKPQIPPENEKPLNNLLFLAFDLLGRTKGKEKNGFFIMTKNKNDWYAKNGFDESGYTYLIIGGNTYPIKDMLKARGAKYNKYLGWHSSTEYTDLPYPFVAFKIHFNDVYNWSDAACNAVETSAGAKLINNAVALYKKQQEKNSTGTYYGEIGGRYTKVKTSFIEVRDCSTRGDLLFMYKFKTEDGCILCWFTTAFYFYDFQPEEALYVSFGVKNHEVARATNEKTTYITRAYLYDANGRRIK